MPRGPPLPSGRIALKYVVRLTTPMAPCASDHLARHSHPSHPRRPEFPNGLPPLPEIHSDQLRLQVFTHRSFYARPTHVFEDMPDDPSPDNEM